MEKLKKALRERTDAEEGRGLKLSERLEKTKYLKRTGSPGNYKYIYKEAGAKRDRKEQPKKGKGIAAGSQERADLKKKGLPDEYVKKARTQDLNKLIEMLEEGYMDIKDVKSTIDDNDVLVSYEEYLEEDGGDPDVGISPREPKPKKKVKPKAPVDLYGYEDQVGAEESAGRLQTKINKLVSSRKIKLSEENLDKLWDDVMGAKGEPSSSDIIKMAKKYSK